MPEGFHGRTGVVTRGWTSSLNNTLTTRHALGQATFSTSQFSSIKWEYYLLLLIPSDYCKDRKNTFAHLQRWYSKYLALTDLGTENRPCLASTSGRTQGNWQKKYNIICIIVNTILFVLLLIQIIFIKE